MEADNLTVTVNSDHNFNMQQKTKNNRPETSPVLFTCRPNTIEVFLRYSSLREGLLFDERFLILFLKYLSVIIDCVTLLKHMINESIYLNLNHRFYLSLLLQIGWTQPSLTWGISFGWFGSDQPPVRMNRIQNLHKLTLFQNKTVLISIIWTAVCSSHVYFKCLRKSTQFYITVYDLEFTFAR